ncbi:hypothetical protein SNEBB_005617 [Seison nebaliae]|nr:hypothetical protein SNEBB_005617 [Seison nebaliae]
MDYFSRFNKITNSVTSVVSEAVKSGWKGASYALAANPISKEYDIGEVVGFGGHFDIWTIHKGKRKLTNEHVSIFVLEKSRLDKLIELTKTNKLTKNSREKLLEMYRNGVQNLLRIKHPQFLGVQHKLEESRDSLAFATESCIGSLSHLLNLSNLPNEKDSDLSPTELKRPEAVTCRLELKFGLIEILDALNFLHGKLQKVHCNINLSNIIVSKNGSWKLFGLDFIISNNNVTSDLNYLQFDYIDWYSNVECSLLHPQLDYLPPEYAKRIINISHDIYSFGCCIYVLFDNHRHQLPFNYQDSFTNFVDELRNRRTHRINMSNVDEEFQEYLSLMLSIDSDYRPNPTELMDINYFKNDHDLVTFRQQNTMFQMDNMSKGIYLKNLSNLVDKIPNTLSIRRIVPEITKEFTTTSIQPDILNLIFKISRSITVNEDFQQNVFPFLRPIFSMNISMQALLVLLKNMDILLEKTTEDSTKNDILPILHKSLDSNSVVVQELCLSILPSFVKLIESETIKMKIFPKVAKLCLCTTTLTVRVNCLVCIGTLIIYLDKWFVIDNIIPFLQKIPSKEPSVLMAILGIIQITFTHKNLGIPKEKLARNIIPFLIPMTMEPSLNENQLYKIIYLSRKMIDQIQEEQSKKLKQSSSITIQSTDPSSSTTEIKEKPKNVSFMTTNYLRKEDKNSLLMETLMEDFGFQSVKPNFTELLPISSVPSSESIESEYHISDTKLNNQKKSESEIQQKKPITLKDKQKMAKKQEMENIFHIKDKLEPIKLSSTKKESTNFDNNFSSSRNNPTSLTEPFVTRMNDNRKNSKTLDNIDVWTDFKKNEPDNTSFQVKRPVIPSKQINTAKINNKMKIGKKLTDEELLDFLN